MRFGLLDANMIKTFTSLSREVNYGDGIEPTELYNSLVVIGVPNIGSLNSRFPTRNEVDTANRTKLSRLTGATRTYVATDIPGFDDNWNRTTIARMERLVDNMVAQKQVTLKVSPYLSPLMIGIHVHLPGWCASNAHQSK